MKLVIIFIGTCLSLKIYHSNLSIDSESGLSGLNYINTKENAILTNSLTVCGRFNYKRLGKKSIMFDIDKNLATSFLFYRMDYPNTFLNFGNFDKNHTAMSSYILNDPKTEEFSIWYTNKWHHVCFGYNSKTNHVVFIKASFIETDYFGLNTVHHWTKV